MRMLALTSSFTEKVVKSLQDLLSGGTLLKSLLCATSAIYPKDRTLELLSVIGLSPLL